MTGPGKPCIRCLTAETPDGAALNRIIRERIAQIPEEDRTEDRTYNARLRACRMCGALRGGTCALCGCYVEIRAARKAVDCPDIPSKWTKI